jgi:hypothetical protein
MRDLADNVEAAHDELVKMPVLHQLCVVPHGVLQAGPDAPLDLLVHQLNSRIQ